MVHRLRLIGLTAGVTALIAGAGGYLAHLRVGAPQLQAPHAPMTIVEIPASAIEAADPPATAPIPPAPLPARALHAATVDRDAVPRAGKPRPTP